MKKLINSLVDSSYLLYLNREDVLACGVRDFSSLLPVVEKAYLAHFESDVVIPKLDYLQYPERPSYDRIIALLGYLGGEFKISGMKEICSSTKNAERNFARASGLIILNDPCTQRPFAILEASEISAARTATATAIAIKHLKPTDVKKVAFIGCGSLAQTHCRMWSQLFSHICPCLTVHDINKNNSDYFSKWAKEHCGLNVIIADSAEHAIRNADIIITLTTEANPYIEAQWIKENSLYAAVSLLDPKLEVLSSSDYLVVDDIALCKHEGRPLQKLEEAGLLDHARVHSIGSLIGKQIQLRLDNERIFFNPMGTIITDLAVGAFIIKKAEELGQGIKLPI